MRKIFQNIDIVSIPVRAGETSLYLPQDKIFADRKINRIFCLSSVDISNYVDGFDVVPASFLDFVYFDLYNRDKKIINRNISARLLRPNCNVDIRLNDVLDYSLSEIKILPNSVLYNSGTYSLLLAFEYQTRENREPFIEPTCSYLVSIPFSSDKKIYKLSDFGSYALNNKKIRRITASGNTNCFFTIREKNGKTFNQIPVSMLVDFLNSENTYFDNIEIDFDNSSIEFVRPQFLPFAMGVDQLNLTFYYN